MLALPTSQTFPADLREFSRCRYPRDLRTGSFAYAADRLVKVEPMLSIVHDWHALLGSAVTESKLQALRTHNRTGRSLGDAPFVERLEKLVGRTLRPQKPGRKPKLLASTK